MNSFDEPKWCDLCPKRAGFDTDIGYLCGGCFYETQRVMVWLLEKFGWRPMDKHERHAHAHKCH